jgi:Phosphotransferase enzyme family
MEMWFNSRLLPLDPSLSFQGCELVLCHLEIAPRNILWTPGDVICLLDWASAGYYSRIFEFCAKSIILAKEGKSSQLVLNSMASLSVRESAQAESVLRAWGIFQKYYLWVVSDRTSPLSSAYTVNSTPSKLSGNRAPHASTQCRKGNARKIPISGPPMSQYHQEWLDQYELV